MHASRHLSLALPALLAAALPAAAQVQTVAGEWSDEFDRPGLVGRVFGLGAWDGKLYAGGLQLAGDGDADLSHAAEFDGETWREFGGGVHGDVRDFTVFEDALIVAGWFDDVGSPLQEVGGVASWDGTTWSRFGDGLDLSFQFHPNVWAVEVFQGDLYAGGEFDSADGKPIATIARWDGTTWQPVGGGVTGGQYPKVLDLHATADGQSLVVSGEFDFAGGAPARNVALWDGSSWSALGAGLGAEFSSVFAVEEYAGQIVATGNFRSSGAADVEKIARWDGQVWQPFGAGLPDWSISVSGYSLEAFGDDLYVGGNFVQADGVPCSRVARWNGAAFESIGGVVGTDLATTAIAMTTWDERLVVGGEFYTAGVDYSPGNGVASESVVAFDGTEWSPVGDGLGLDGGADVMLEWQGQIVAAGGFRSAGTTNAYGLATFDGAEWTPLGYILGGQVKDAVVFEGDLVITGNYDYIDGVAVSGTQRLDADTGVWSPMPGGGGVALEIYEGELYGLGLGEPRVWNGVDKFESFGAEFFGQGYDLHAHDGKLYFAGVLGSFSLPGENLYSWDGVQVEAVGGTGTDQTATSLASWQGDLIVGGEFTTAGGVHSPRLARWDGSQFSPLDLPFELDGTWIHRLHVYDGDLYVSGDPVLFASPYDFLCVVDDERGLMALPGGGPLGQVMNSYANAFATDPLTGQLLVGGGFFLAGGLPAHGLTRFDRQTSFTALGGAVAGTNGEAHLAGTGLLVGGDGVTLVVADGPPQAPTRLAIGFSELALPLFGGLLVPSPDVVVAMAPTDAFGATTLKGAWPTGIAAGTPTWWQAWFLDVGTATGLSATNGLLGTAQ